MTGPELLRNYLDTTKTLQGDFASRAGVSEASVSLWLSGKTTPSGQAAILIQSASGGAVPFAAWFPKRPRKSGKAA